MYIILPKHCSAYESLSHILVSYVSGTATVAHRLHYSSVAKFIVPDWGGIKSTLAQGCLTGPPGYIGLYDNTYAGVNYIL